MFFQLFSTMKVNLVAKIMQTVYICVIFHVKHKKLSFLSVLTWFLILGKIQHGGKNGKYCWWRHRPPAAPPPIKYICVILLRRSKAFHQRWNHFKILQHIKNSGEGFHPSPLPLDHSAGINLLVHVCPRVYKIITKGKMLWSFIKFSQLIQYGNV